MHFTVEKNCLFNGTVNQISSGPNPYFKCCMLYLQRYPLQIYTELYPLTKSELPQKSSDFKRQVYFLQFKMFHRKPILINNKF